MQTVNWVALAYTLSYLGCALFLARISDVIGRRDAFLLSYIIFVAFSLGCGFAQSLQQLIAFRAIQGLGGSGMPYSQTSFDGVLADFLGLYSITSTHPVMFVFRFR